MSEFLTEYSFIIVSSLICFIIGISSFLLKLEIGKRWLISSLRAFFQLLLLAFILQFLFKSTNVFYTILVMGLMLIGATATAFKRQDSRFKLKYFSLALCFLLSAYPVAILANLIQVSSSFTFKEFIPILGFLLGNSLNGIMLGIDKIDSEFLARENEIITRIGLGEKIEFLKNDFVKGAIKVSMTPITNVLAMSGVVSFPGFMTGQMMAGIDPLSSAFMQFSVLLLISSSIFIGSLIGVRFQVKNYLQDNLYLKQLYQGKEK